VRIAVDAFNLETDRRGMGRIVRQTLRQMQANESADVVLVKRDSQPGSITPRELRALHADAVWYPWNAMRFAPHAPAIVTINDPFAFTYPHTNFIARLREQQPIRRAVREAGCILTISQWSARELQRLFGVAQDRLHVVLPAPDPFWHPVTPPAAPPYVLFVGGPDARKNTAMLCEAFDAAFHEGGAQLVVAGTLNAADEARVAKLRAPHRRVVPSDEELRELYSGALGVAVPSLAEGFGLPVVEAMACGVPVLAAAASALPEAAGDAAVLLPPLDVRAWTEALRRIVEDEPLRQTLRERGFARVARMDPRAYAIALLESARRLRASAR